ncbi:MAG: hypothetical protein H7326_00400 [Bdellovibrionaceae bacterium]|nr:hypothetical protein [Pseudobdellovibrionaceae bacterium]
MSEAGGQATASEGASTPGLMSVDDLTEDFQSMDYVDPQSISPQAACSFGAARSVCASNVSTIDWGGCNVGLAKLTGGWTETWSAGFCANGATPSALTTSTAAHTTYDSTSIPATGITTSMSGVTRTVVVNGIRRVLVGPRGRSWFDHSITSAGLTVTGTRAGGNRVVSGTSTMFHNLAQYKAVHTFNSVTWGSSACCYPTSGSVSSTLTGTRAGNVSLTFSATCGQATFVDMTAASSTIALSQCN